MRATKRALWAVAALSLTAAACGGDDADDASAAEATTLTTDAATATTATPPADEPTDEPTDDGAATTTPDATTPPSEATEPAMSDAALPDSASIMAPADAGGGWDSTARAFQTVADPLLDGSVEVYNRPGAGGTVGLAEFVGKSGSATDLLVMGSVMVGAILTNDAPVTLAEVTRSHR